MEHSVQLKRLPEGLQFPERLGQRIRFDAAAGRLSFQGFMTKCSYDELSAISEDGDYHRALEQLFVLTSEEVVPETARRSVSAAVVLARRSTALLALLVLWSMSRNASAEKRRGPSTARRRGSHVAALARQTNREPRPLCRLRWHKTAGARRQTRSRADSHGGVRSWRAGRGPRRDSLIATQGRSGAVSP